MTWSRQGGKWDAATCEARSGIPLPTLTALLLLMAMAFIPMKAADAASTDSITVSITPNAYYSVDVDTTNVSLDLGTLALGASTQTIRPSTVTIDSTFATTDLKLQGVIASAGTAWTFDTNAASTETDTLAAWATFTSIARSSAPAQGGDYFSGSVSGAVNSDLIDAINRYVGSSASDGTSNLFENNSGFDSKDMDAMAPMPAAAGRSHLWLYFRLPSTTSSASPQNISLTITAVAPD